MNLAGFYSLSSPLHGTGLPRKRSRSPQTCLYPQSPLPLLKRKEELKMKLKHNSIRSGSRVKSSALIVCWQALPAPQQTQCYQGTEGRFVCTGRASCCVRPACPGVWGAPGCTAGERGCRGLGEAPKAPAARAGSSVPARGALAGGHTWIQPPCTALWPEETGQAAPSECQHRVKATEGQGPRVMSLPGGIYMASSSMGAAQLLGQEAAELADPGIPPPGRAAQRHPQTPHTLPAPLNRLDPIVL